MSNRLQTLNSQNKLAEWAERVAYRRNSDMSANAWCKANGACKQTYYKQQKRLYNKVKAQQESQFVEITPISSIQAKGETAVTVRIAGAIADIHTCADAVTVETVLRILKSC